MSSTSTSTSALQLEVIRRAMVMLLPQEAYCDLACPAKSLSE